MWLVPCAGSRSTTGQSHDAVFLLGGTAFSGKTLLAHLLNQENVVCLDEPDFHNLGQSHRGIAVLNRLFPDKFFPAQPNRDLTFRESVTLLEECEKVLHPASLGMKTAGWVFIEYAKIYRESGYPVIGMIRDIRDVLAEAPLPEWVGGEEGLNQAFRSVWENLDLCDLWIRYEDFVAQPETVFEQLSQLLGVELEPVVSWNAESVPGAMFKLDRHEMLRIGRISRSTVGIGSASGQRFSSETWATAAMMGYGEA